MPRVICAFFAGQGRTFRFSPVTGTVRLPLWQETMTDEDFLSLAFSEAQAAGERQEVPIGAVLVGSGGAVLARNGNRTLELRDPTAHAEMLVLRDAATKLGNERLLGTTL